jgi:hypothetical protein
MTTVTLLKQQHRNVLDHLTEPMTHLAGTGSLYLCPSDDAVVTG